MTQGLIDKWFDEEWVSKDTDEKKIYYSNTEYYKFKLAKMLKELEEKYNNLCKKQKKEEHLIFEIQQLIGAIKQLKELIGDEK